MSETKSTPQAEGPTAWQRMQEERRAEQAECRLEEAVEAEPDAAAETQRAELLRCADAFERTAARLRKIVGDV